MPRFGSGANRRFSFSPYRRRLPALVERRARIGSPKPASCGLARPLTTPSFRVAALRPWRPQAGRTASRPAPDAGAALPTAGRALRRRDGSVSTQPRSSAGLRAAASEKRRSPPLRPIRRIRYCFLDHLLEARKPEALGRRQFGADLLAARQIRAHRLCLPAGGHISARGLPPRQAAAPCSISIERPPASASGLARHVAPDAAARATPYRRAGPSLPAARPNRRC